MSALRVRKAILPRISATGISDGWLLNGVNFHAGTIETQSLVLRYETGTRRLISTEHRVK